MKMQIKATDITLSSAIKDYAERKVSSLDKFFNAEDDVITSIEVGKTSQHHKSGNVFRAEISIRAAGKNFYAASEKNDLYAAIDEVKDEIHRKIISSKNKKETLVRRGGAKIKALIKRLKWKRYE